MSDYVQRLKDLEHDGVWAELGDYPGGPAFCKDKTVYSSSRIVAYSGCKMAYKLQYEDGMMEQSINLQGWRGTMVHHAVNVTHKRQAWDGLDEVWNEAYVAGMEDLESGLPWSRKDVSDKDVATTVERGRIMFLGYCGRYNPKVIPPWFQTIDTEVDGFFILRNPRTQSRYRVAVKLDQLRGSAEHIHLADVKTGVRTPTPLSMALSQQVSIYNMAVRDGLFIVHGKLTRYSRIPDTFRILQLADIVPYERKVSKGGKTFLRGDLRGDIEYTCMKTQEDLDRAAIDLCNNIRGIRMGIWARDDDAQLRCLACKFSKACLGDMSMKLDDAVSLAEMDF